MYRILILCIPLVVHSTQKIQFGLSRQFDDYVTFKLESFQNELDDAYNNSLSDEIHKLRKTQTEQIRNVENGGFLAESIGRKKLKKTEYLVFFNRTGNEEPLVVLQRDIDSFKKKAVSGINKCVDTHHNVTLKSINQHFRKIGNLFKNKTLVEYNATAVRCVKPTDPSKNWSCLNAMIHAETSISKYVKKIDHLIKWTPPSELQTELISCYDSNFDRFKNSLNLPAKPHEEVTLDSKYSTLVPFVDQFQ